MTVETLADWVAHAQILRLSWSPPSSSAQTYWSSLFAVDPLVESLVMIDEIGERSDLLLTMDQCTVTVWSDGASRQMTATVVSDPAAAGAARNLVEQKFVGEQAFQDLGVVAVVIRLDSNRQRPA